MAQPTIPTRSSSRRVETDSVASIGLAADHGEAQTERARQNFRVAFSIIQAPGLVKLAAEANGALGSREQRRDRPRSSWSTASWTSNFHGLYSTPTRKPVWTSPG